MDGKGFSNAAKAVVTVCFLEFMTFFCLDRLLIALAVLFVGIIGLILLTAAQIRLENREQRHFIRNILTEYGKIVDEDNGDYKNRGLAFLESELEYSKTHSRLACNKNYLGIFLAAHYGNISDMDKCGGYIDMVSPEELKRDGEFGWLITYYSVKMEIAVKKGEYTAAKELYEKLCGEIDLEKYVNDPNLIKMRSEYLLICGDFEGALTEADRLEGKDIASRFAAFQCRFNALLNLGRLEEAEVLMENMRSSGVPDIMQPVFGEFEAAIKRKKGAMEQNKEKSI